LAILELAAKESETAVTEALRTLLSQDAFISPQAVKQLMGGCDPPGAVAELTFLPVDLGSYDLLLNATPRN
jgi:hypothetical protein